VDVLDLVANQLLTRDFEAVAQTLPPGLVDLFATTEPAREGRAKNARHPPSFAGFLTFERLLAETEFPPTMRELLRTLHQAYDYPVDIEFTANFQPDGRFRVNLVQCRPFQVKIKGEGSRVNLPETVAPARLLFASRGPIVGQSLAMVIDRLIYVVPAVYGGMTLSQRYSVARTIGRLVHLQAAGRSPTIMLVAPGRWGTSMPSLGVPVSFAEINRASVLCELTIMHEGLVPDVSLGTHFFNDLVEMDMLYLAVSPGREGHALNEGLVGQQANQLTRLLPTAAEWAEAIRVIDSSALKPAGALYLNVDSLRQRAVCYCEAAARE
jgi:hypothetical protein